MRSALPIMPGRLLEGYLKAALFPRGREHDHPRKIGICVSGGPDSMALAYLLQNEPHPYVKGMKAFFPHAFVIDHSARDGSYDEAMWVKSQLETLNIETDVRTIKWPTSTNPASLEGFEHLARAKRYYALANLATTHNVKELFTGHHQDDLIETIMSRLLRDRALNPFSYLVMRPPAPIPSSRTTWANPNSQSYGRQTPADQTCCEVFSDGVQLHRPLLEYRKSDLIATCDYFKIRYVHDKTNFDPQLTVRNTIRHLRAEHTLPKALQGKALLSLHEKTSAIADAIQEQARKFYRDYVLGYRMHNQSGVILLRLKTLPVPMDESQLRGFSCLMENIIALISPVPVGRLSSMLGRDEVERILSLTRGVKNTNSVLSSKVKCARVEWKPSPGSFSLSFSRQPISSSDKVLLSTRFTLTDIDVPKSSGKLQHYTFSRLWDSRFWIAVTGEPNVICDTVVRPYAESDRSEVIRILDSHEGHTNFVEMLAALAPGRIRYTLPVLVVSGKIVAFPTLDFATVPVPPIGWSVHYARNRRSIEFFFPGIKDKAIMSWNFEQSTSSTRDKDPVVDDENYKRSPLSYWDNMTTKEEPSHVPEGQHRMLSFLSNRLDK